MKFEPMLAKTIDSMPEGPDWVCEAKWDGWRIIAGHSDKGTVWLETRTGNRITTVPYVQEGVAALTPRGSVIDGELVSLDGRWNRVQTIASRSGRWQHVPSEEDPALALMVFDVLILDGEDLRKEPLVDRRLRLEALFEASEAPHVNLQPQMASNEYELERLLGLGFEGAVVKHLDSKYVAGRRAHGWHKIKAVETIDVVVTGFYDPEPGSKYDGVAVGGIEWRAANGYEGRAAGMDDALRQQMHESPDEFVGRVIEIAHYGETDDGAFRHPQFKRFRDDKDKDAVEVQKDAPTPRGAKTRVAKSAAPRVATPPSPTAAGGRQRNYRAMGAKIEQVYRELADREGDAYDRCMNGGSGDVENDMQVCRERMDELGISY